jgi:hypothetical protein
MVGLEPKRWTSEQMSLRVVFTSCPIVSNFVDNLRSALMGEKKPWAAGMIVVACLYFPTTVWNTFIGTDLRRIMLWVSLMH